MPRQKSTPSKHGENGQPPPLISNADLKTEIGKWLVGFGSVINVQVGLVGFKGRVVIIKN